MIQSRSTMLPARSPPPQPLSPTHGPAPVYSTYCASPIALVSGGMCQGPGSISAALSRPTSSPLAHPPPPAISPSAGMTRTEGHRHDTRLRMGGLYRKRRPPGTGARPSVAIEDLGDGDLDRVERLGADHV